MAEGRFATRQLMGKDSERPNVNLLTIGHTADDLGREPVCRADSCVAESFLLVQQDRAPQVRDLNLSRHLAQDVVGLDVPMDHVLAMKMGQALCGHVQRVLAERFGVRMEIVLHDVLHGTAVHLFEDYEELIFELVELLWLHNVLAVDGLEQRALALNSLLFDLRI